jgi:phosphoribosylamine--glycine ligase
MKILLIDIEGLFLDFALRCMHHGHEVRWFISPNKHGGGKNSVGDGLVKKVPSWELHMNWADLIITSDNIKYIHGLESYRERGYPIFGPNKETRDWELERESGQEIFRRCGIETMDSVEFKKYDEAIAYVTKNMKRYVSKPNGDADKALSYVSKSPQDMCFMLDHWKKNNPKQAGFILQEFTPGIEMAVGGWFGPHGWSKYFLENFEHKKLMNEELGVNTGEMGTVLRYVTKSKLADEMLLPLTGELFRQEYTGFIDVSVIIDKQGHPWPLEFTTRPGWPLFQIQQAVHKGDPAQWMLDLINGKDTLEVSTDIALGVVIAMPPFPYKGAHQKQVENFPIYGITSENINHLHFIEAKLGYAPMEINGKIRKEECMVSSNVYTLVVSETGKTVKQAKDKCYKIVKQIEIPNSPFYRTDIGCRLEKQLPELQKLGYATSFEYGE